MKVRLLGTISGTRDGKPWPEVGETIDLPAEEAKALCENRQAVPLDSTADTVETRNVTIQVVSPLVEDLPRDKAGVPYVDQESTVAVEAPAKKTAAKKS